MELLGSAYQVYFIPHGGRSGLSRHAREEFSEVNRYPEGHVLYRNFSKNYPLVTHGQGIYLYDERGRQYLDGSGGAYVTSIGHGHHKVVQKITEQMSRVAYVNGMHFSSEPLEKLCDKLHALSGGRWGKSFLLSSGSEAVEAAVKLIRQLWVARGEPQRWKILTRDPSYHGNTMMGLSLSARKNYKAMFAPYLNETFAVETPYRYRSPVPYDSEGGKYYADQFRALIEKEGPQSIAAIVLEPVSGSSAGATAPPRDYLERVQTIAKMFDIPIIADEVLVGAGRTGKFFASDHFSFHPDIVVLGKSLNGGFIPASAVLVRDALVQELKEKSGNFLHAQTYMHHPVAAAACLAVIEVMESENLLDHCVRMGRLMEELLRKELSGMSQVGHIESMGLLAGVELVRDRMTKEPFERSQQMAEKIREQAFEEGLIVWSQGGQCPNGDGDIVLVAPPLIIQPEEIAVLVSKLKRSIRSAFEKKGV